MRALRFAAPPLAAVLALGACARAGGAAADEGQGAAPRAVAPALAAPCAIPSKLTPEWKAANRPEGISYRVPPGFNPAPADIFSATYRRLDAEINVWTGGKYTFPLPVPGRSNRCTVTVNGREVGIQVVELESIDSSQPAGASSSRSRSLPGPRIPVYLATATWGEQLANRYVYAQLRTPLLRDLEQFPTLVFSLTF